jgi:hypothetical protein
MSQQFQEAVAAARAGEKETAQHLLIDILEENPAETQAWFLLSHLVDGEEKQVAYLKKVVALDPTHAKARQRLSQLQPQPVSAPKPPISADPFDFEAQAAGDTLPEWMADEETTAPAAAAPPAAPAGETPTEIPDWLQTSLDAEADELDKADASPAAAAEPAQLSPVEAARQAAKVKLEPTAAPDPDAVAAEEAARLNQILTVLIILAVLIVVIMGYLIFI